MKKILVTGGAGFIGSHIVDRLIKSGYDVVIIDNMTSGRMSYVNPLAKLYLSDIRDEIIDKVFEIEKPEIVFHLAAQASVPHSVEVPAFDLDVNLRGLLNLLSSCVKYDVQRFIFSSSGGTVYGEPIHYPLREDHPTNPICPYGITKLTSEKYLYFYKLQYGLDFTVLRYANVYGPRQISSYECGVVTIFAEKVLAHQDVKVFRYKDGPDGMERDYVYIDDVVDVNIMALESAKSGIYNVGNGKPNTTGEIFENIKSITGITVNHTYGPPRFGDLTRNSLNIDKARNDFGWEPKIDLITGLEHTLEYFRGL